jgi:hypothetical protein
VNTLVDNPYVGPRTFSREEADRFFGRDMVARQLLSRVISERLVLFYAQSGAGKSSLINTRLIPQLQEAGFRVLPIGRVGGKLPEGVSQVGNIYTFNLILSLAKTGRNPDRLTHIKLGQFLDRLTLSTDGDSWYYEEEDETMFDNEGYEESPYVLIIDQFEEIVTTYIEYWPQRDDFFRELNQTMSDDPLLSVVLVLREDYIATLEPYAQFLADRMRARFYMQRLGYEAALEAVTKPAELGGHPFAPDVAETLVDNLRQIRVLGEILPQPGQFVEPVQLQVVCYQLWKNINARKKQDVDGQITLEDLKTLGDVDLALSDYYKQAINRVLKEIKLQKSLRERIMDFLYNKEFEPKLRQWFSEKLITEAETRGTVYRGDKQTAGIPTQIADALANQYLLRSEIRAGGKWYELTHDRFIQPILRDNREWQLAYVPRFKTGLVIALSTIGALLIAVIVAIFEQTLNWGQYSFIAIASWFGISLILGVAETIFQTSREFYTAGRLTLAGQHRRAGKLISKAVLRLGCGLIIVIILACTLLLVASLVFPASNVGRSPN